MLCVFRFSISVSSMEVIGLSCVCYVDSFNIKENFVDFKMFGPWDRNFNAILMRLAKNMYDWKMPGKHITSGTCIMPAGKVRRQPPDNGGGG